MIKKLKQNWKWLVTFAVSIAAVIPAWMVMYPTDGKGLSYEIKSISSLVATDIGTNGALKVVYEGTAVSYPYLTIIRIENTGNLPLLKNDFDGPLNIVLGQNVEIFDVSILEKNPESIKVNISERENRIEIAPTLLNENDSMTIKIITGGTKPEPNIYGRIAGVKDIYSMVTKKNSANSILVQVICFFLILSFSIVQSVVPRAYVNRCNKRKLTIIKSKTAWIFIFPPFAGMVFSVSYLANEFSIGYLGAIPLLLLIIVFGEVTTKLLNLNLPHDYKLCELESTSDSEESI